MSATEEDTELRDLLIQNLENSGVLNKIKAELRVAVFLALEEQEKVENKTPLVNENLKKSLNTKDGRLVAGLITDFLQVFNLDFTLAVFQPEINTGDRVTTFPKDRSGAINRHAVTAIFSDLFPQFSRNMLESYVTEELRAKGKDTNSTMDFQDFLGMYKCFFIQCRSVVANDNTDALNSSSKSTEDRNMSSSISKIPRYKGFIKHSSAQEEKADPKTAERRHGETQGFQKSRGSVQVSDRSEEGLGDGRNAPTPLRRVLDLGIEDEDEEGDSFFDDPLPKPQKTYGCNLPSAEKPYSGQRHSEKSYSQKDLSALGSDQEGDAEDMLSEFDNRLSPDSEPRRDSSGSISGKALLANVQLKSTGGSSSAESSQRDPVSDKNGTFSSKDKGVKVFQAQNEKTGSPLLDNAVCTDEDLDYDDDFNSHRSENSKSEVSIGEEIEEVSIEGPDISDKLNDTTQDVSVSQISLGADYMEDVA
ncbi:centrosomal protein 43-like isoform X6 [Myxocyprinus asiaticus]|uniref:centrosomal protein 43-like isoform X6 n=1 Tax=Myxocyprinus asiaticus TaxID=70543 RepID=UPI0022226EFE|nr:centrosomal protein 43-like isoform X6 [Myxocyprinus asiaticus]